jgi:hypothetical protein
MEAKGRVGGKELEMLIWTIWLTKELSSVDKSNGGAIVVVSVVDVDVDVVDAVVVEVSSELLEDELYL